MEPWPAGLQAPPGLSFPMPMYNYMFPNPMVTCPMPFPPGLPAFGPFSFGGGVPSIHPFNLTTASQHPGLPPQAGADDEKVDTSSHRPDKHMAADVDTDAELARKHSAHEGSTGKAPAHSSATLKEAHPSSASLMSFAAASHQPNNPMRSLHSSVTALTALDALAPGASMEFLQGMSTSMSATMLNVNSSPHHVTLSDPPPPPGKVALGPSTHTHTLPISSALPSAIGPPGLHNPSSLPNPILTIMPLIPPGTTPPQDPPSSQPGRTASGRPSRRVGNGTAHQDPTLATTGMTQDQLASATMAQLQAFLHQSQAVMSPRSLPVKVEPQGSASASRKSGGRLQGAAVDPVPAHGLRSSVSGTGTATRRVAGLAASHRSASHPQLSSQVNGGPDAAPSSSRSRNANGGPGGMARISSLQALVEVAAAAADEEEEEDHQPAEGAGAGGDAGRTGGGTNGSSMACSESGDPEDLAVEDKMAATDADEGEVKRLKRKQSNRESARRSRLKKQAEADALTRATSELQAENNALRAALTASQGLMQKLVHEKAGLVAQVRSMGGDVLPELDWQLPVIHMPALMGMAP